LQVLTLLLDGAKLDESRPFRITSRAWSNETGSRNRTELIARVRGSESTLEARRA
jgi:hypothetical protein